MKKTIGLFVICLLGACSSPESYKKCDLPQADQAFYTQKMDTVPWPWVQIIPSERAATLEEADFSSVDQFIRLGMALYPKKFEKITLVLVDYAILPEKKPHFPKAPHRGMKFSEKYLTVPKRYMLEIRFYGNKQRPPAEPLYMGTVIVPLKEIYFREAMQYMVDSLMLELGAAKASRIFLELDTRNAEVTKKSSTTTTSSPSVSQKPKGQPV
jgi:hypothetical protein